MNHDIIALINDYLGKVQGTTVEQMIMRLSLSEITTLRKERDHLMQQLINIGEKPNDKKPD